MTVFQRVLEMVPDVYFRKWVAIDNKKLYVVQNIMYVGIVAVVIFFLISMPVYNVEVTPMLRLNLWAEAMDVTSSLFHDPGLCNSQLKMYDYKPSATSGWAFRDAKCAQLTNDICINANTACVHRSELVEQKSREMFFATSFVEEISETTTGAYTTGSYVIPGVMNLGAKFTSEFQVRLPSSYVHQLLGIALLETDELLTIVVDKDGKEVGRYTSDQIGDLTIGDVLNATGSSLEDIIAENTFGDQFPPNMLGGTGIEKMPRGRVTGLDVIFNYEFSNSLADAGYSGPVAKVTIDIAPAWMTRKTVEYIDDRGSTRTRTFGGVRFKFNQKGLFSWFQLNRVIYTLSLGLAWLQIPFFLVFYFAIMCLGTLSEVYTGFLYEDVDLHREFNGTSSRMLEVSYGFHDVHDVEENDHKVWGASQSRMKRRMDMLLELSQELDKKDRDQFTNFFFLNCATQMPSHRRALKIEDFRRPHMLNENLLFEDVLKIVDSDKASGNILEMLFMDDSLKEFSATAESEEAKLLGRTRKAPKAKELPPPHAQLMHRVMKEKDLGVLTSHSTLMRGRYGQDIVQEQMDNLNTALDSMHNTCGQLETNEDEWEEGEDYEDGNPRSSTVSRG